MSGWMLRLRRLACISGLLWLCTSAALAKQDCAKPTSMGWAVADTRELPAELYVQGFAIRGGRWYLSGGGYGQSQVQVLPAPGQPWRSLKQALHPRLFAEGLGLYEDSLWLLTWRAGRVLVLDANTLELQHQHRYPGQGWGLDWDPDEQAWVMSDGSNTLRWRSAADFSVRKELKVFNQRGPVTRLNELEHTAQGLWANQWQEDQLLLIDTNTGCVRSRLDLSTLWPSAERPPRAEVLNGIALDRSSGLLWVTGKFWGRAFGLNLTQPSSPEPDGISRK